MYVVHFLVEDFLEEKSSSLTFQFKDNSRKVIGDFIHVH